MNGGRVYGHSVRRAEAGRTLLSLLTSAYPHASHDEWCAHIREGRVTVDQAVAEEDLRLDEGAQVLYHRSPWMEPAAPISDLHILHDDGALVVLHKPSGLPVIPSELYYEHTVLQVLKRLRSSEIAPHPTHRLGVGTSGLLLCAIGSKARSALSRAFESRAVSKTYLALASGHIDPRPSDTCEDGCEDGAFVVDCPIGPVPHCSWAGSVHGALPEGGEGAKPARSIVRVTARLASDGTQPARSLVEVRIPTGRAHQIRIHMAFLGHPLLGDPLYAPGGRPRAAPAPPDSTSTAAGTPATEAETEGRPPLPRDGGYLLHAWRVELPHPVSGERVSFEAQPPPSLLVQGKSPTMKRKGAPERIVEPE